MRKLLDKRYFSDYKGNCSGYLDSPNGYYTVLPYIGVASIKKQNLPKELEQIIAFDAAEVSYANIGKINAITVSSFISPNGKLAGHVFFSSENEMIDRVGNIDICSLDPLLRVTLEILGGIHKPAYPIFPGSMVPCASKDFYSDEEASSSE